MSDLDPRLLGEVGDLIDDDHLNQWVKSDFLTSHLVKLTYHD